MSSAQRDDITSPAAGLVIWCNNCVPEAGMYSIEVIQADHKKTINIVKE